MTNKKETNQEKPESKPLSALEKMQLMMREQQQNKESREETEKIVKKTRFDSSHKDLKFAVEKMDSTTEKLNELLLDEEVASRIIEQAIKDENPPEMIEELENLKKEIGNSIIKLEKEHKSSKEMAERSQEEEVKNMSEEDMNDLHVEALAIDIEKDPLHSYLVEIKKQEQGVIEAQNNLIALLTEDGGKYLQLIPDKTHSLFLSSSKGRELKELEKEEVELDNSVREARSESIKAGLFSKKSKKKKYEELSIQHVELKKKIAKLHEEFTRNLDRIKSKIGENQTKLTRQIRRYISTIELFNERIKENADFEEKYKNNDYSKKTITELCTDKLPSVMIDQHSNPSVGVKFKLVDTLEFIKKVGIKWDGIE